MTSMKNMAMAYEKFPWAAFLLVLLFGFASCSSDVQLSGPTSLPPYFGVIFKGSYPPSGPSNGHNESPPLLDISKKLNFGVLPKEAPYPPSDPSSGQNGSPLLSDLSRKLNFDVLPNDAPYPPSGPGNGHNGSPPLPNRSRKLNVGALPNDAPYPPSGPGSGHNRSPILSPSKTSDFKMLDSGPSPGIGNHGSSPLSYKSRSLNFGALPKEDPVPPSAPGGGINESPPLSNISKKFNFGMFPSFTPIPPSGPSNKTSASPPPPSPSRTSGFGMLHSGPSFGPPHYEKEKPPHSLHQYHAPHY